MQLSINYILSSTLLATVILHGKAHFPQPSATLSLHMSLIPNSVPFAIILSSVYLLVVFSTFRGLSTASFTPSPPVLHFS